MQAVEPGRPPSSVLSDFTVLAPPMSHTREPGAGPNKLALVPPRPIPDPRLSPNPSPHRQKQLHRLTVITKPQSLPSNQSAVLRLSKNGTRNQTAWIQRQIVPDRASDIT